MTTFSDFFRQLSILGSRPPAPEIERAFGQFSHFFDITARLDSAKTDDEGAALVRMLALKFWLLQSAVRNITLVVNDQQSFEFAVTGNIDKTIIHARLDREAGDVQTCLVTGPNSSIANLTQTALCALLAKRDAITDYDFETAAEKEYTKELFAIWCSSEVYEKSPRLAEAVVAQTRSPVHIFVWWAYRASVDDLLLGVSTQIKRRIDPKIQIATFNHNILYATAHLQNNLSRCSFYQYFSNHADSTAFYEVLPSEPSRRRRTHPTRISAAPGSALSLSGFPNIGPPDLPPVCVGHLKNARVFGPACNIATEDGRLLCIVDRADWDSISTPMGNSEPEALLLDQDLEVIGDHAHGDHGKFFSASYANCIQKIKEPAMVLGLRWHGNFGHFLLDMLPRLMIARQDRKYVPLYVVVGHPLRSWAKELLNIAGFDDSQILPVGHWAVEFSHLIVPGRLGTIEYGFGNRLRNFYDLLLFEPRRPVRPDPSPVGQPQRIFISRTERINDRRTILNMGEVRQVLARHDVQEIIMEDLTVKQKMSVFANAELIVLVLGAAYTNLLLTHNKACKLILILPDVYQFNLDIMEVVDRDQDLTMFYAETVSSDEQNIRTDMVIDCVRFERVLGETLSDKAVETINGWADLQRYRQALIVNTTTMRLR